MICLDCLKVGDVVVLGDETDRFGEGTVTEMTNFSIKVKCNEGLFRFNRQTGKIVEQPSWVTRWPGMKMKDRIVPSVPPNQTLHHVNRFGLVDRDLAIIISHVRSTVKVMLAQVDPDKMDLPTAIRLIELLRGDNPDGK